MYLFTSECVSPGHPDKVADIIADTIVQDIIEHDQNARVASEVFVAGLNVIIGGEIKTDYKPNYEELVKNALVKIGYSDDCQFTDAETLKPKNVKVQVLLNEQSADIRQGVNQEGNEIGAGDQGIMFGYACDETRDYMPSAMDFSRRIMDNVYKHAKKDPELGVDIKTQVTIDYGTKENFENCKPQRIHTIVASVPCVSTLSIEDLRQKVKNLIASTDLPEELFDVSNCVVHNSQQHKLVNFLNMDTCILHINPTGKYVNHSPLHDSGLTGRKLIVDSFGGYSPIGGGAQSSKDYTKVDRSGLYAARWVAKNIVAAGLAKKCAVQLSYAIGVAKPLSISVDTYGTYLKYSDDELSEMVMKNYSLSPRWIIDKFGLDKPFHFNYADVAARGQVGQSDYPWEKIEKIF